MYIINQCFVEEIFYYFNGKIYKKKEIQYFNFVKAQRNPKN